MNARGTSNYRVLAERAPHGILVVQDGHIRFANERATQFAGQSSTEALLGRRFADLVHPSDRSTTLHAMTRPHTIRLANSTQVRGDATEIEWDDATAILLILVEVTSDDQNRTRELQSLFDNINDAIFIHDVEGNFLEVNAVACTRLGYSREELLNLTIKDINASEQGSKIPERLKKLWDQGHIVFQTEHKRRDGSTFPTEINSRLHEHQGRPALLSVARDTTERHRLTTEIIQAQKMESVGLLASGLAHDFNNILGSILGLSSLLQRQLPPSDQRHRYLDMIDTSVRTAADLTARLLALARKAPPRVQSVDLNAVVRATTAIVERTFDKCISVEEELDPDLPLTRGDEGQLMQTMMNLCLNSRDAMPGGGTIAISTSAKTFSNSDKARLPDKAGERGLVLAVSDTGHGIGADIRDRVFEPFFTTKPPGRGTGLGLSTVHWVVKNHGGFCSIDSEPGRGTTFCIVLPAGAEAEERAPTPRRDGRGRGELVLVVDDDDILRVTCGEMLVQSGYRVVCAEDGAEACELYSRRHDEISLVLLDVVMPKMGAGACLAKLREIAPNVKVVLMSGYDPDSSRVDDAIAGYLQKPFGPAQLADAVRAAIDGEQSPANCEPA